MRITGWTRVTQVSPRFTWVKHLVPATVNDESDGLAGFQVWSFVAAPTAVVTQSPIFSLTDTVLAMKEYLLINSSGRGGCKCRGEVVDLARLKYPCVKFSDSHEEFVFSVS